MSKAILELGSKQIIKLVETLPLRDKIQLAQKLNLETWKVRFKRLISGIDKRLKNRRRLSDERIVQIVRRVRGRNYAQRHH